MKKISTILFILSFNFSYSQIPTWVWENTIEGFHSIRTFYSVKTDAAGNVYTAGSFNSGTISFGNILLYNQGDDDVFLAKYNSAGTVLWAKVIGGSGYDFLGDICVNSVGEVCVTGTCADDSISFDTITLHGNAGSYDMFMAKYDSLGNVMWANQFGGLQNESATSICTDYAGNIYTTGYFGSSILIIGNDTMRLNGSSSNILTCKFSANGQPIWARRTGGWWADYGMGVACDQSGNVYITGYYGNSFQFGFRWISHPGNWDTFVGKYDANGNEVWGNFLGGSRDDKCSGLAIDSSGNIYVSGYFNSPQITSDTVSLNNVETIYNDGFIAKYNNAGHALWIKGIGGQFEDVATAITTDFNSDIYVAGYFTSDTLSLGASTIYNSGLAPTSDMYVAKFNPQGNPEWLTSAGGPDYDEAYSICSNSPGNLYVLGITENNPVFFGSDTLYYSGGNIFVANLNSSISTGVNNLMREPDLKIYPNPTTRGSINISNQKLQKISSVQLFNMQGEKTYDLSAFETNQNNLSLDLSSLQPGLYVLKIQIENQICTKIIVVE